MSSLMVGKAGWSSGVLNEIMNVLLCYGHKKARDVAGMTGWVNGPFSYSYKVPRKPHFQGDG